MFDLDKITRDMYIDEIKQHKDIILNKVYIQYSENVNQEISKIKEFFNRTLQNFPEIDYQPLFDDHVYEVSLKKLSEYRFLSSLYIGLLSIWELQVRDYNKENVNIYYNAKMTDFIEATNVLKHGKYKKKNGGKTSYQKLKEMDSKYLESSYYFKDIIEHLHGGEILNISLEDLKAICDEMIRIWSSLETKEPNI